MKVGGGLFQNIYFNLRTISGYKLDHLALNSTTAVAGKAGFTITLAAIAVGDFMATWLNLYPLTVRIVKRKRNVF